jgi:2-C-methyl-D-erythritol 2,4-cyclodiphosphate synthase
MQRRQSKKNDVCLRIYEQRQSRPFRRIIRLFHLHQRQLQQLSLRIEGFRPAKERFLFRIGFGYDVHRLTKDRPLILGGVHVPYPFGLEGHSDADVLVHAVMDAVVGALGKGDIGRHFPDTDSKYKNISSLTMLNTVAELAKADRFRLNNLDVTVVAQAPKLAPFIPEMRENLARIFETAPDVVNIKATTSEGLGFCGKREGMEAFAVASLIRDE